MDMFVLDSFIIQFIPQHFHKLYYCTVLISMMYMWVGSKWRREMTNDIRTVLTNRFKTPM